MGADRIESGVLSKTPIDSPGAILVDPASGALGVVNNGRTVTVSQASLLSLAAQTALTNITTAQNLFSQAIAAGLLNKVGRTFLVTLYGTYNFAGGSTPTITIALKLGSVTLATITTAAINTAASTNLQFQATFQCTVVSTGTGATLEVHGQLAINISANTPGAALAAYADQNTAVSSGVDLTISENLVATIASSGTLSGAQLRSATVELMS
jgi:hypothetical protein